MAPQAAAPSPPAPGGQGCLDHPWTPLHATTFVVVDLETTGLSPSTCAITEVGAVKLRGGECLGTLQTLVNPGLPIPPAVTFLTGITQAMVLPAPPISEVLPALLEFMGGSVVVGHNVRFDAAFLGEALRAHDRPGPVNRTVDTRALARRLVADEVRDCRLSTLSEHFRVAHRPTHRALDDALATGEVFHCLLERAGSLGVLELGELMALPRVRGPRRLALLRLAARLPRRPGAYLFRDAAGRVLYVGSAPDLRRRVRAHLTADPRRRMAALLRQMRAVDHVECDGEREAAALEARLLGELAPPFNREPGTGRARATRPPRPRPGTRTPAPGAPVPRSLRR